MLMVKVLQYKEKIKFNSVTIIYQPIAKWLP